MTKSLFCYMPLVTYPDVVPDASVQAAVDFARGLECRLHVTTFSVDIPQVSSPLGNLLLDIPDMIRTVEARSQHECQRLKDLVIARAGTLLETEFATRHRVGFAGYSAAKEAMLYDLSLLPWAKDTNIVQDVAQTVVFESGRPAILVPPQAKTGPIRHLAIAWDASRVAARALADAVPLLSTNARVTVLTVVNEKPLEQRDIGATLAAALQRRGLDARARDCTLGDGGISGTLQAAALDAGADLLVMGGFGHSRLRDFVLGGATLGVFSDLRMPVLLSH